MYLIVVTVLLWFQRFSIEFTLYPIPSMLDLRYQCDSMYGRCFLQLLLVANIVS